MSNGSHRKKVLDKFEAFRKNPTLHTFLAYDQARQAGKYTAEDLGLTQDQIRIATEFTRQHALDLRAKLKQQGR